MSSKPVITVLTAPGEALEKALPGLDALAPEVQLQHANDESALSEQLAQSDILVVTDFRNEILRNNWPREHSIRWVHATSAGVDALMFPALVNSEVTLTNARGLFDRGIAEYVLGAILLFAKDSIGNIRLQQQKRWQHRETALIESRRVLVVGAGSIGQRVAELLTAVGMDVTGTARSAREQPPFTAVHAQSDLPELLSHADYVVITAPLTDDTQGLFDYAMLCRMSPHAQLINVGRGPIVKTDDLLRALNEKRIAGAALDVFEEEPLPREHPLWEQTHVMLSAHMAGDFVGWQRALAEQFIENFRRWQRNQTLHNIVDKKEGRVARQD